LIHVGFAVKIDQEEAELALASLQMMGEMFTDEVDALMTSPSTTSDGMV
jgi:hydrogenase maturation factor